MTGVPTFQSRGSRIGDYIIESEIGRGGMGVVYRAHKADTGEVVALKLMLPELVANPEYRKRFVREAELGPNLDHPNIVPIFDAGETGGQLFIAMRLVEGRDLKEVIKEEGRLDPGRVLAIFRQAAAALDAAHESGVVHRDVKPQNMLVGRDADDQHELVYISDFGLVKPVGSESNASRTGQILGSIQYMSPELVEGVAADGRADVYSLGCVLYECLTGRIPFDRPNEVAVLWAHVHEDPPRVSALCPELPGGLDAVIGNALAKHPDDRFLTCGELVAELERGLDRRNRPVLMPIVRPLVSRAARRKTEREVWAPNYFPELSRVRKLTDRTNWVQVTAVTAVLCLLAASLVQFGREGGIPQAAADVVDLVQEAGKDLVDTVSDRSADESQRVSDASGSDGPGGVARSGEELAAAGARGGGADQPAGGIAGGQPVRSRREVAGPAPAAGTMPLAPATPRIVWVSGRQLFGALSDLWVMRADGSGKTRLTNTVGDEHWPDWSPDGKRIVYTRDGDIWLMNFDGSGQEGLGICSGERPCSEPEWSPDGSKILFSRAIEDLPAGARAIAEARIFVLDLATGAVERVPTLVGTAQTENGSIMNAAWSPDGRLIAGTCRQDGVQLCLVRSDGTFVRRWAHSSVSLTWSPDGKTIAGEGCDRAPDDQGSICLTHRAKADYEDFPGAPEFDPTWSHDGSLLAYTRLTSNLHGDIFVSQPDGSAPVQLTDWPDTTDIQPDWWGPAS